MESHFEQAPVVGLYLLRLCMVDAVPSTAEGTNVRLTDGRKTAPPTRLRQKLNIRKFCSLGLLVCLVFCACLLPVVREGRLREMISRLFPFGRGLVHSYWAPNVWALYLMLDRGVLAIMKVIEAKAGVRVLSNTQNVLSPTAGVTGATLTAVLPNVNPLAAVCATAVLYYPILKLCWSIAAVAHRRGAFEGMAASTMTATSCLYETCGKNGDETKSLLRRRNPLQHEPDTDASELQPTIEPAGHRLSPDRLIAATSGGDPYFITLLAMGSGVVFLTGWHVHEKAILTVTIPLGICVWKLQDPILVRSCFWLNTIANFSLLPLMHSKSASTVALKYAIFFASSVIGCACVLYHTRSRTSAPALSLQLTSWYSLVKLPLSESFLTAPHVASAGGDYTVSTEPLGLKQLSTSVKNRFQKVAILVANLYLPVGIVVVGGYDVLGGVHNVG
eukprot:GHVS01089844.1.p1 GENE.GHVS01089844.1~~GHVS01089844.1.p1  ORF type:complete len:446 (+),score=25.40 GHVS01089844.1:88-1425(+)